MAEEEHLPQHRSSRRAGGNSGNSFGETSRWETIPEIYLLTEIATELRTHFRIRGSIAAAAIAGVDDADPAQELSLFDFLSPLSDVDLVVPNRSLGRLVLEYVHLYAPTAKFFHWDIKTEPDLKNYRNAFVVVDSEPTLTFSPERVDASPMAGITFFLDDAALISVGERNAGTEQTEPRWNNSAVLARPGRELEPLLDALYISHRYPRYANSNVMDELDRLTRDLPKQGGTLQAFADRIQRERLLRRLLKLGYARRANQFLLAPWLERLLRKLSIAASDPLLRAAFTAATRSTKSTSLKTMVLPRLVDGRWTSLVHDIQEVPLAPSKGKPTVESDAGNSGVSNFRVWVDEPSSPGCCLYRDFSRGVAEFVWSTGDLSSSVERSHFVAVDLSSDTLQSGENSPQAKDGSTTEALEIAVAPAWALQHKHTGSIRTDYNFLCLLAGAPRPIKVIGHPYVETNDD